MKPYINLDFKILTALVATCSTPKGKTVDEMKDALPWETPSKQVQAIINYMVVKNIITPLQPCIKGGKPLDPRWVTNKHINKANQRAI